MSLCSTEFIDVKGWKALGNKLFEGKMMKVEELSTINPLSHKTTALYRGFVWRQGGDKGLS